MLHEFVWDVYTLAATIHGEGAWGYIGKSQTLAVLCVSFLLGSVQDDMLHLMALSSWLDELSIEPARLILSYVYLFQVVLSNNELVEGIYLFLFEPFGALQHRWSQQRPFSVSQWSYTLLFALNKQVVFQQSESLSNYARHCIVIIRSRDSHIMPFLNRSHVQNISKANCHKFIGQCLLYLYLLFFR